MLRAKFFNTVCRHFLRWVLFFDRIPAISRHALQAHSRMLRISQPAQMSLRDVENSKAIKIF